MKLASWHKKFVQSGPQCLTDYLAYIFFFPLAVLYGLVAKLRVLLYRSGVLGFYRAPVPVISIGNLAAGGTGKTPVTSLLLSYFLTKGLRVAVVSRGYGRKSGEPVTVVCNGEGPIVSVDEAGDEPLLLAHRNPSAIVVVSPDRKQGIARAVGEFRAELILLDDGFQHLKVKRDLDILLLDAQRPFGNGFPLPFGNLREFPSAADRSDLILLTRSSGEEALKVDEKPTIRLRYVLAEYAVGEEGEETVLQNLTPGRIGAFAGIADPESFFSSLAAAGINPVETLSFADHAVYDTTEQAKLQSLASRSDVLLTTEKDLVKLKNVKLPCECLAVPLKLEIEGGEAKFFKLVEDMLDQQKGKLMLSEQLIEMLACPKCKGEVEYNEVNSQIICEPCGLAYPVRDNIPVMLVDEAEVI